MSLSTKKCGWRIKTFLFFWNFHRLTLRNLGGEEVLDNIQEEIVDDGETDDTGHTDDNGPNCDMGENVSECEPVDADIGENEDDEADVATNLPNRFNEEQPWKEQQTVLGISSLPTSLEGFWYRLSRTSINQSSMLIGKAPRNRSEMCRTMTLRMTLMICTSPMEIMEILFSFYVLGEERMAFCRKHECNANANNLTLEFIRLDYEDLNMLNKSFPNLQVLNLVGVGEACYDLEGWETWDRRKGLKTFCAYLLLVDPLLTFSSVSSVLDQCV
ncbi:unnamed protein product [Lactuca saligna]|uniref:FBD domain-containing protein n=1 Tax=Lactuca saligna TaxID=75948 RepID=A0AA36EH38_LACSI|nr:unnamed protein product [Lactuca saligna]